MNNYYTRFFAGIGRELDKAFRSLHNPNYRLYTIGQFVSLTGSHLQSVALAWTTYLLTQSAYLVGMVTMANFVPTLLLSPVGGIMADRFERRKILVCTQLAGTLIAAGLCFSVATGLMSVPLLIAFGIAQGIQNGIEMPVRQAFVFDVVGEDHMVNAAGVNSLVFNTTRFLGPMLAALVLAWAGDAVCFALNSISYLAAIETLRRVRVPKVAIEKSQDSVWTGLREALSRPAVRNVFFLVGSVSFFAVQYITMLPVVVAKVLNGNATEVSILTASAAFGSIFGGIFVASRGKKESLAQFTVWAGICPGLGLLFFSLSHTLVWMSIAIAFLSMSVGLVFMSCNSYLQLNVASAVRGRVLSLYTAIVMGAVPFGSLLTGYVADASNISFALTLCAIAPVGSSLIYIILYRGNNSHE